MLDCKIKFDSKHHKIPNLGTITIETASQIYTYKGFPDLADRGRVLLCKAGEAAAPDLNKKAFLAASFSHS